MQFLDSLPETFASTRDIHSATGAAMQAALKLIVSHCLTEYVVISFRTNISSLVLTPTSSLIFISSLTKPNGIAEIFLQQKKLYSVKYFFV